MKKRMMILVLGTFLMVSFSGCALLRGKAVLPPVRIGEGRRLACLPGGFENYEKAYANADIVARIRIGKWLGESEACTLYEAQIIEKYKGSEEKEIILAQDGTQESTFSGYPLFTHGDEFFVFLVKTSTRYELDGCPELYDENEVTVLSTGREVRVGEVYVSGASYVTVSDIFTDQEGKKYIFDPHHCGDTLDLTDYTDIGDIKKEAVARFSSKQEKEVLAEKGGTSYPYPLYSIEEIISKAAE